MTDFKVHCGNPEVTYKAQLEDMDLCYVSKFTIEDGNEIVTYIKQDNATAQARLSNDHSTLNTYGYYITKDSFK